MTILNKYINDTAFSVKIGKDFFALLLEVRGDMLRAATADDAVWVEFTVAEYERYTTLTICDWQGIADRSGVSLHVSVPFDGPLHLTELDYMTTCSRRKDIFQLDWLSPSKHFGVNPAGGIAVFEADSDEEHDETLLHIWVEQGQPHPSSGGSWDLEYARNWLVDWQETFGQHSQMVVNAESLEELYNLVPYAEKAGIDEIYIFTNTWRPDLFWPMTDVNWALNKKVFPNGRADLRAYSDFLAEKGIRLALHYVSGGFGLHDPVYVGSKPHPELAAWGTGSVHIDLAQDLATFAVTPGAGMVWPLHERGHFADMVIQVGDELIVPEKTLIQPDGSWVLTDCQRGAYDTVATTHGQGSAVKFLVVPYAQNFVPDNNSDLLYEVADNFASLLNECNVAHAEFDGAEIHCYDGSYGYIKFAQRIYEKMDHAISGHDSSASAPRCFFEYRFKSTQQVLRGSCGFTHGDWLVPFQIDSASRPASTLLDANFFLSQGHWGGAMGISKPEPMFGITTDMLAAHGLTDRLLDTLQDWKIACQKFTVEQHQLIEASLSVPDCPMPEASHHRVADTVYTAKASGEDYELVPVRVMTRAQGDIKWQLGQEYGPLSPHQFVRLGESLRLVNPFVGQSPEFVLRVLPAYDREASSIPLSALSSEENAIFDEKDFFVEGNQPATVRCETSVLGNIELLPPDFEGLLQGSNSDTAPGYHVRDLPSHTLRVDLSSHRGLGIELEGDASGALVLVQLEGRGCRDYVVPVDFEGTRYVEIPCGEVSWARDDWGWRMGTKTMDYARVAQCRIGLGMVPEGSTVSVRVKKLTALAENHQPLENPCILINDTSLQIEGSVPTGHYLVYKGGDAVDVYDPNWHRVQQLRVSLNSLQANQGENVVKVETLSQCACPWLELQFLVKDMPVVLG